MIRLAALIDQFRQPFLSKYGDRLLPSQLKALDAITACKHQCGYFTCECDNCHHKQQYALSCGHRSCPQCQNSAATDWLQRQQQKLIPCDYFMVTFTVPEQLRTLFFSHQYRCYELLFTCAIATLKELGLDKRHLGGKLGMTAVLHTHTRQLAFHPHVHVIVPGAALINNNSALKRLAGKYLIRGDVIAKMFRGKLLYALYKECFELPENIPSEWVVNVKHIGQGLPALKYLSRYLYRGVISQNNIVRADKDTVTFRYIDSETHRTEYKTLPGEDFIWNVLAHVLPRRFRRVREYGFLHHNARKKLTFIQYLLRVKISPTPVEKKPILRCSLCQHESKIIHVAPNKIPINFRFMKTVQNE